MSSSQPVISVRDVGKCYQIFDKPSDRLLQAFVGSNRKLYREFWALQDISFDVHAGDCMGVLGANGSGKSTLLQLVTGTLAPTTGTIDVRGRVAALLELGSGFNPEFTGRENVFMNGAILGFSDREIRSKFDAIVDFSGIEPFIDQPVKTYSSGMMIRLAFAVQVQAEPDVLIIDEALAVGDARFQLKCLARIQELRDAGTTLMFVSHSIEQVKQLCTHAMVLHEGIKRMEGDPIECGLEYYRILFPQTGGDPEAPGDEAHDPAESDHGAGNNAEIDGNTRGDEGGVVNVPPPYRLRVDLSEGERYGRGGADITSVWIEGLREPNFFSGGELVTIHVTYRFNYDRIREIAIEDDVEPLVYCGIRVDSQTGVVVTDLVADAPASGETWTRVEDLEAQGPLLRLRFRCTMPRLQPGDYFLSPAAAVGRIGGVTPLVEYVHLCALRCVPNGLVHGLMRWDYEVEKVEAT